jgi:hypothetical protein
MSVSPDSNRFSTVLQYTSTIILTANGLGWGFFVLLYFSSSSAAELRKDPEFEPMVMMANELSRLAPVVLILGLVASFWKPRWFGIWVTVLGLIGTLVLVTTR